MVTGRSWEGAEALVQTGARHVIVPGPSTRLSVAEGFGLGGHRAVALIDSVPKGPPPEPGTLAFTTSASCAAQALLGGWTVVQPWNGDDVEPLLGAAQSHPALILLAGEAELVDSDPPTARRSRLWLDGDLATLVASGTAVPAMVRLASRLQQRGVDVAAVEIALLDAPAQAPLIAGKAMLIGGQDTAVAFRGERWPDEPVHAVPLVDHAEADLIGAVLSRVSVRR